VPLGAFQVPTAMAIASGKALVLALFFMHLVEQPRVHALVLGVSLILLVVFIGLTAADVATRQGDDQLPRSTNGAPYAAGNGSDSSGF
jgi:cytochrome c oxidase subunit IV